VLTDQQIQKKKYLYETTCGDPFLNLKMLLEDGNEKFRKKITQQMKLEESA